jgi:hypothetical protein
MKIWEQNSSGGVVQVLFDNQWGAPDTAGEPGITPFVDLTTPLIGGNINLHKTKLGSITGATPPSNKASIQPLTSEQLAPIVQQAINAWIAAGIDPQQINILDHIGVNLTKLPSPFVGMSSPDGIWIDQDAAGYGWFVDPTPADNREFSNRLSSNKFAATPGSAAYGKIDLLTIVEHEMGRPLGLQESPDAPSIMANNFRLGVRELPSASDLAKLGGSQVGAPGQAPLIVQKGSPPLHPAFSPGLDIIGRLSAIGILSGDFQVAPQGYPVTSGSSDSNQAVLSAVLADRGAEFDLGARMANLLMGEGRNDFTNSFSDEWQRKINHKNEFWASLANSDFFGGEVFGQNWNGIT